MFNKINPTTERIFNQTKTLWDALLGENDKLDDLDDNFLKSFPILNLADSSSTTIAIFNYQKFKPEFITDNVESVLGFTKEEYLKEGSKLMFSYLHPSHADFPIVTSQIIQSVFTENDLNSKSKMWGVCCGLMFNHSQKGLIRAVMRQFFIPDAAGKIPIRAISQVTDVTHLMKDDFYWFRVQYGDNQPSIYRSDDKKIETHVDILSFREKEILRFICEGKDADFIAEALSISRNTVNNHRQSMLDKIGAKDTTALVELAQLCRLI